MIVFIHTHIPETSLAIPTCPSPHTMPFADLCVPVDLVLSHSFVLSPSLSVLRIGTVQIALR